MVVLCPRITCVDVHFTPRSHNWHWGGEKVSVLLGQRSFAVKYFYASTKNHYVFLFSPMLKNESLLGSSGIFANIKMDAQLYIVKIKDETFIKCHE